MSKDYHFSDLADAVETLREDGFNDLSEKSDAELLDIANNSSVEMVHSFQQGTDPGYESTLYQLNGQDGNLYFIVVSFGMYQDRDNSDWLDILERKRP